VRQPELTSLIGLRGSAGDRLLLIRLDRPDGTRGYMLKVGTGSVLLTARELEGLSSAIRFELVSLHVFRSIGRVIGLLIFCALAWLLTSAVTGPLFAYPWSN